MSIVSATAPNLQRGFFTGQVKDAPAAARSVAEGFLARPVRSVREGEGLIHALAAVLPSWQPVADGLSSRRVGIQIANGSLPVNIAVDPALNRYTLTFSSAHRLAPASYFADLQRSVGYANVQLAGLASPPMVDMSRFDGVGEISSRMWQQLAHHLLLVETSFLQSMLEACHINLHMPGSAQVSDWVTAVDMAWYRTLRTDGLLGMAESALSLLSADYREALIQRIVHELRAVAASRPIREEPLRIGEAWNGYRAVTQGLPATVFDDREAVLREDCALYRRAVVPPLPASEASALRAQWVAWLDTPIVTESDVGKFPDFVRYAAPGLYAELGPYFSRHGMTIDVRDHFEAGATWLASPTRLFEDGGATAPIHFTVERGMPVRNVIINGLLESIVAPHPFAQLVDYAPSTSRVDQIYARVKAMHALIATGRLELLHGGRERRLRDDSSPGMFAMHAEFLQRHGAAAFAARIDNMPDMEHLRMQNAEIIEAAGRN